MDDIYDLSHNIKSIRNLFLQTSPRAVVISRITSLPGWPSIEIQSILFSSLNNHIKSYPPSKKWLGGVLKDIERSILSSNETNDRDDEISDELAELVIFNYSRMDDDNDTSHVTISIDNMESIFKVYRSHNQVGTRIWEAGLLLAELFTGLSHTNPDMKSMNFFELGSGVGISGIVLKKLLTDGSVTMTDFSADVLSVLQENIDLNFPFLLSDDIDIKSVMDGRNIFIKQLEWTMIQDMDCSTMSSDLIFAADCTYSQDINSYLVDAIGALLNQNTSSSKTIVLSDDVSISLPGAIVACTVRNMETFSQFLYCLSQKSCVAYSDITSAAMKARIVSDIYYEYLEQIRVIYIYPTCRM